MSEDNSGGAFKFGANKPNGANIEQKDSNTLPVGEQPNGASNSSIVQQREEINSEDLSLPYTDERSISVSLVKNFSLYRRANDKVLPKKKDYIGSSIQASRVLSSNKDEIEAYFPPILGIAANNPEFINRVKQYLNNIRVGVDELHKTFVTSFVYNTKADYYRIKAEEEKIESGFIAAAGNDLSRLKAALKDKITKLNVLEGTKHKFGYPVNVEDYILYRHCLLYNDIAKDVRLINSDSNIRFYFKDDQKEADRARKHRAQINQAKVNYVAALADDVLFDAVYTQYLVAKEMPVIAGLLEDRFDREVKLDKFSFDEPVKFNAMVKNKDAKLISSVELLIARGELQRSQYNQNVSTTDGTFIGSNMTEVLAWFKHPDNASTVDAYFNRLKHS